LKNGLEHHRDVVPNFAGSQRAGKIVRVAEAPLATRQLKKPGKTFSTDCYRIKPETTTARTPGHPIRDRPSAPARKKIFPIR
jgi:hypothetical protein